MDTVNQENILTVVKCDLKCKNGGQCILNHNNQPTCKCKNYAGDLCEIRLLRECKLNEICYNGGSCLANGQCLCPPGFSGSKCEHRKLKSHCGSTICFNGGTCMINQFNEYECVCDLFFSGKFCELKKETNNLGSNNVKSIINHEVESKITCPPGYTGSKCEHKRGEIVEVANQSLMEEDTAEYFTLKEIATILLISLSFTVFVIFSMVVINVWKVKSRQLVEDQKTKELPSIMISTIMDIKN